MPYTQRARGSSPHSERRRNRLWSAIQSDVDRLRALGVLREWATRFAERTPTHAASRAQAAITMLDGSRLLAVFAVADAVREESREAFQRLHGHHFEVIMIAGDARAVAKRRRRRPEHSNGTVC